VNGPGRHTAAVTDLVAPLAPHQQPGAKLRTAAWVLYDLANTVYSATLTFLFIPYATASLHGKTALGFVQLGSMLCAGMLVPVLGALVDHTTRTRRYLTIATLLCIIALAGFGLELGPVWMLGCFFVANLTYNLGLLFYNTLLPAVASDEHTGRVSGIGVGVGYLGTLLVLSILLPLKKDLAPAVLYQIAAAMFLGFGLPCMLLVRDGRRPRPGNARVAMRASLAALRGTLRDLPRHRALLWFLLGNFCLVDVLNTAILFFADFTMDTFRDSANAQTLSLFGHEFVGQSGLDMFLLWMGIALNGLAFVYGLLIGRWTDRAPIAVMRTSAVALLLALIGGTVFGGTSALGYLLTLVALGAFGLVGIWTAGRKVVVMLAPKERIGEYFGLYGITLKLSVFGAAIYGVVADGWGAKPAMLAQGVQLLLGFGCLAMVRLPRVGSCWTLP